MIQFTIPIEMNSNWSLNKIYSGKHWSTRKRDADAVHDAIKWTLMTRNPRPKVFPCPVEIEIEYDCRLDIDNCGYMSKLIIDGLKGIVIKDDTKKYVVSLKQSFWNGGGIRITVKRISEPAE